MRGSFLCVFAILASGQAIACPLEPIGAATVAAVRDGRTLLLLDGREVRLAGIDAPAGRAALERLAAGREVTLKRSGTAQDRYGRVLAYVFAGDDTRPLQQVLLADGHARVSARAPCAAELLAQERLAREAKLDLWADSAHAPRRSSDPSSVLAERGRFTLVEGKVLSVREAGGTIYVNFGRRWTRDFTVTISKRNERTFTAAGLAPKSLEGREVRVRGYVERRGGPVIEATRPEQIEIAGLQ